MAVSKKLRNKRGADGSAKRRSRAKRDWQANACARPGLLFADTEAGFPRSKLLAILVVAK